MSWEQLVYPWGTSSLNAKDPDFHPYHLAPEYYPKDAAYHNGAIWLWLNGIAMQRMIELEQEDQAFRLFKNMTDMALNRGGVGGLAENMDAIPRPNKTSTKITGTFLQAWSNAEHLRVWYQDFIGFKPNVLQDMVSLRPRIPEKMHTLKTKLHLGQGYLDFAYDRNDQVRNYQIINKSKLQLKISLYVGDFDAVTIELPNEYSIVFDHKATRTNWLVKDNEGITTESFIKTHNVSLRAKHEAWDTMFETINFASPDSSTTYKVLN
jgi:hypothetical protein